MGSFGTVPLKDVWDMLDHCAPGYTHVEKKHRYWVYYNDQRFTGLPKGAHGKKNPGIEIGHIKKMLRMLGINEECAQERLPILK